MLCAQAVFVPLNASALDKCGLISPPFSSQEMVPRVTETDIIGSLGALMMLLT